MNNALSVILSHDRKWPFCLEKNGKEDFPDRNPPANAADKNLTPGLGRSHMPQGSSACAPQILSPCSRANKLQLQGPSAAAPEACASRTCVPQEKSRRQEAHALQRRVTPPPQAPKLEKALTATKAKCNRK